MLPSINIAERLHVMLFAAIVSPKVLVYIAKPACLNAFLVILSMWKDFVIPYCG